ncbi:MAG: TlyA family RNA methyltransferase [Candidatus Lokiarchaeota archaeon]|nr:TlyA family RNA methyltransferase [Candidatus Lokiarchaeota archaeon]
MRERLDILLVERRLVESRTKGHWLIKNGYVLVNNEKIYKPGKKIDNNVKIELLKQFPYVGMGGLKLEFALEKFFIQVKEKICADLGASVGGFTDCLLKYGAKKVYSIDTASGFLHPSLKCQNEKVIDLSGVDVRLLDKLNDQVEIVVIDITFASLKDILPNTRKYLKEDGDIIVLVKPIFELDFESVDKFEIISDKLRLKQILGELIEWGFTHNFYPQNIIKSSLLGKGGSIEYFIHFKILKRYLINKEIINEKIKSLFRDN